MVGDQRCKIPGRFIPDRIVPPSTKIYPQKLSNWFTSTICAGGEPASNLPPSGYERVEYIEKPARNRHFHDRSRAFIHIIHCVSLVNHWLEPLLARPKPSSGGRQHASEPRVASALFRAKATYLSHRAFYGLFLRGEES